VKYALEYLNILDDSFLDSLQADLQSSIDESKVESVNPLQDKIARITDKKNKIIDWCLDGKIDDDEMQALNEKYHKEIAGLKSKIAEINERNIFIKNAKGNMDLTLNAMRNIITQEEATPELYAEVVDKVLLYKNHEIDIYFKHIYEPVRLRYTTSGRGRTYRVDCNIRAA